MRVWNLNDEQVRSVVEQVSGQAYDGNLITNRCDDATGPRRKACDVTLRVKSSRGPGHRLSASEFSRYVKTGERRRLVAACWHAQRDVMIALFDAGATRIKSAMADYKGRDDFDFKFEATADRNVGSMMYPVCYGDLCECDDA